MPVTRRFGYVQVAEVTPKSVLNRVHGMGFGWSINPYQGCFHQCVFCYARKTHRYREQDGTDGWGTQLTARVGAAAVLRRELARPSWRNERVAIGTATDPYQSIEGRYRITRGIIAELARAETPAHLITRSPLIVRDIDVLTELARKAEFSVAISLPTLDADLARRIEPTVAPPTQRLRAVRRLADAGIRVGIAVAPVLPHLTDDAATLASVMQAASGAGASFAWHSILNLGDVARETYVSFLDAERPDLLDVYRDLYRTRYAPGSYEKRVEARVESARTAVTFAPPDRIVPDPPRELRLL